LRAGWFSAEGSTLLALLTRTGTRKSGELCACFRPFVVFCFTFHHQQIMRPYYACLIALCLLGMSAASQNQTKPKQLQKEEQSNIQKPDNPTADIKIDVDKTEDQRPRTPQNNSYYEQSSNDKWTAWLVGINAVYVVFSALTFLAIYKQTKHAGQQLAATIESLRPHITVDPHENPAKDFFDPRGQHFYVAVTNVGGTAAYDLSYETWLEVMVPPFRDFSNLADHYIHPNKSTLRPNSKPMIVNIPLRREFNPGEERLIKTNALIVCVRVLIAYRDSFSPSRYANFGYKLEADGFGYLPKYQDSN
jgi:hypothetical protein